MSQLESPLTSTVAEPRWAKNLLFMGFLLGGTALLILFLMGKRPIPEPASYASTLSNNSAHREIWSVARQIDQAFAKQWASLEPPLQIAPAADDLTIARRLGLGLAGTLPSVQEIREFEKQPVEKRVHWWVSRLLEDRRTSDHVAERLARALVGVDEGPFILFRRSRFADWISNQFFDNIPYDEMAREVLSGEGLWTDSPAVNFYTKTIAEEVIDPVVLAGKTSRAFLGMRIDCLQCHDDFIGTINMGSAADPAGGLQTDFHGLAAYFGQVENSVYGVRDNGEKANYEYRLLDEEEEVEVPPQVPFLPELMGDEPLLRERLSNWVTHPENRPFARATVNRFWAILCGRPLIEPVDDIPLEGPFPLAMEILADDFSQHGFDVHRLIRVIVETEAFQRSSFADFEITKAHENNWAVFPMRRLRPDQVAGAIIQSTSLTPIDSRSHIVTRLLKFGQKNDFVKRFGDAGESEFNERGETVTQRLLMLNGEMIAERINGGLNSTIRMATISPSVEKAIETVYLATLVRRPTGEESMYFKHQMDDLEQGEQNTKLSDLYWTLINSLEFAWNH